MFGFGNSAAKILNGVWSYNDLLIRECRLLSTYRHSKVPVEKKRSDLSRTIAVITNVINDLGKVKAKVKNQPECLRLVEKLQKRSQRMAVKINELINIVKDGEPDNWNKFKSKAESLQEPYAFRQDLLKLIEEMRKNPENKVEKDWKRKAA